MSSGAVLIVGPPGSGKSSLARGFMRLALQNGQPLLVLSTEMSSSALRAAAERLCKKFGGDAQVVDCYQVPGQRTESDLPASLDLAAVGKLVSESLKRTTRPFVIFDSLDGIALSAGEGPAIQFLLSCLRQLETSRTTGVATATTGIHTPRFDAILRTYFSGVLELKVEESGGKLDRYLRVYSLRGTARHTDWQPFTVTEEGITLGTEESRSKLPPRHSELHFLRFTEEYREPFEVVDLPTYTWEDLGGSAELKEVLRETIELPLSRPDEYKSLGVRPPRGVLLYGPPGGGKTHIARVLASVVNANMVALKGSELLATDFPEKRIAELFAWARSSSPTIIFFDEIDALALKRSLSTPADKSYRVVTQLLSEIDGLQTGGHVIVIATTNHPEMLDEAMLRPGRLDRQVYVAPPDAVARKLIFERLTRDMPVNQDVDYEALARLTDGYSAADISAVCNEAKAQLLKSRVDGRPDQPLGLMHFQAGLRSVRPSLSREMLEAYERFQAHGTKA